MVPKVCIRDRIAARKDRYVSNLIAARMFVWSRCYQTWFFLKLARRALRGEVVGGYEYEDVARDSGTVLRRRYYFSVEPDEDTEEGSSAFDDCRLGLDLDSKACRVNKRVGWHALEYPQRSGCVICIHSAQLESRWKN